MDNAEIQDKIKTTTINFEAALAEFTRQSGYVEGTLDTMIAMMMEISPEVSMIADKLIKTFHAIEGICKQGLAREFESLLSLCTELANENIQKEVATKGKDSLDETINILTKKAGGK